MEQLIKTLKKWQEEAAANEFCGLKEDAVYKKVIDEIEKMKVNSEIKDRIEQADRKETNFDHYRDEWIEALLDILAVTEDGRIQVCDDTVCEECIFYSSTKSCTDQTRNWLMSEYEPEKPKLIAKEKQLVELLETGWIARDESGDVCWYQFKPKKIIKNCNYWKTDDNGSGECLNDITEHVLYGKELFEFIEWSDDEPWSVEDLRELEVQK